MKMLYYLLHFLSFMAFILPASCSFVEADRCTRWKGSCRRKCLLSEKHVDICPTRSKICCVGRSFFEV
ncbi:beta-defensin 114 [Ochotona princeps]|uniref:beta-defensin 114 n=1 Tax=Ochotona princeps TaxID=9978 RepID=UPI0027146E46|nr:beta-defensin 114 [Ochotona princeps]